MSGGTWAMMIVILGVNWGGFVLALAYGIQRDKRRREG
ncbi:hypothetical protein BH23ACI1_BH23ACI1_09030 [soil metagenome]